MSCIHLKVKLRLFLTGYTVAMVTHYVGYNDINENGVFFFQSVTQAYSEKENPSSPNRSRT